MEFATYMDFTFIPYVITHLLMELTTSQDQSALTGHQPNVFTDCSCSDVLAPASEKVFMFSHFRPSRSSSLDSEAL